MNEYHLKYCASDEWAEALERYILPGALDGIDPGDDVLEVGPGPGRTTDLLRQRVPKLTAVEIDRDLASALATRMEGTNVEVLNADATDLPFPDGRFSAALSFIMLHHVPTAEQQDRLFAEVHRVLRPGAVFAGVDSLDTPEFRDMHVDDICNPVVPDELEDRLRRAGFSQARVDVNPFVVEFHATR